MSILWFILSALIAFSITAGLCAMQVARFGRLSRHPWKDIFSHRATLITYVVLRVLATFALIRGIVRQEYESALYCALALVLYEMPMLVSRKLKIELSPVMEVIVLLFIYASEILGEVESYYVRIPGWDTALHTANGFLCAAIGFSLVDMLNRNEDFGLKLSPFFLALVAFCFSMTIGVLWEFIEFTADLLLKTDMQKDFLVGHFSSVYLDTANANIPIRVGEIVQTTLTLADGSTVVIPGGYLDLGIFDTMKDLMVNALGAIIFSVLGYLYVKFGKASPITQAFIPLVKKPKDVFET